MAAPGRGSVRRWLERWRWPVSSALTGLLVASSLGMSAVVAFLRGEPGCGLALGILAALFPAAPPLLAWRSPVRVERGSGMLG